jgi:hypothetical protein
VAIFEEFFIWAIVGGLIFLAARPLWRLARPGNASHCTRDSEEGCGNCPLLADLSPYEVKLGKACDPSKH